MEITLLTLVLAVMVYIALRLDLKDRIMFYKFMNGGDYAVNRRLREILFEKSVYAVVATDLEGKVLMWNEKAFKKFGYTEEEMIGQNIRSIMPERFRTRHESGMKHYRDTGESRLVNNDDGIELTGLHKSGDEFPIHLKIISITDNGFKLLGGFIRNITKDKAREKVLVDELNLLRNGEKSAEVGAWQWNLLTRVVLVSDNFYTVFNCDKHEEITSDKLMNYVYHEDRQRTAFEINKAIENRENYKTRYRRLQEDGSLQWLEVRGCLVFDDEDEIISIFGTIQKVANDLG